MSVSVKNNKSHEWNISKVFPTLRSRLWKAHEKKSREEVSTLQEECSVRKQPHSPSSPLLSCHTWQCLSCFVAIGWNGEGPEWPGHATEARLLTAASPSCKTGWGSEFRWQGWVHWGRGEQNIFRGGQKKKPRKREERFDKPFEGVQSPVILCLPCTAENAADMVRVARLDLERASERGKTFAGASG